jgi:lysophospholipase L1-like esterase
VTKAPNFLVAALVCLPILSCGGSSGDQMDASASGGSTGGAGAGLGGSIGDGGRGGSAGTGGGNAGTLGTGGAGMAGSGGTSSTGTAGHGGAGSSGAGGGIIGAGGHAGMGGGAGTGAGNAGVAGHGGASGIGGAAGAGGKGGGSGVGGSAGSGLAKIMAIGDSITRATCWRDFLWQELHQNYLSRFDLVGTLNYDYGCGVSGFDADNQGYSSSLITEVVAGITNARTCDPYCPALSDIQTAFQTTKPNVLLMHWGTNDVWNGKSSSSITSAYSSIIDALRAVNPSVTVLLAQIIPMNVTSATCAGCSCASCGTAVPSLNAAITTFAASKTTAASPVIVVDQYDGFDATTDTRDGVHPNTGGSQKMADKWYGALTANHLLP